MRTRIQTIIAASGAALLATGLSAAPSLATAAGTWSVSPGGSFTAKHSGKVTLTDTKTKKSIICTSSTAAGTFKSGHGLSGTGIGSIHALSLTGCTEAGRAFTVRASAFPWSLSAEKYNPAITAGLTTGTASGIHVAFSASGCSGTLDGTSASAHNGEVVIHFHNSLSKLKFEAHGGNLHAFGVAGCSGLFKTGDTMTIDNAYLVTPAQTITET